MKISNDQLKADLAPTTQAGSGGGFWPKDKKPEQSSAETEVLKPDTVQLSEESQKLMAGSGGGFWPDKKPE
ncbi:MAG: hypothetical protein ACI846_000141 [Pseudoalteromonas distincta]|jgi:hypothetical protein